MAQDWGEKLILEGFGSQVQVSGSMTHLYFQEVKHINFWQNLLGLAFGTRNFFSSTQQMCLQRSRSLVNVGHVQRWGSPRNTWTSAISERLRKSQHSLEKVLRQIGIRTGVNLLIPTWKGKRNQSFVQQKETILQTKFGAFLLYFFSSVCKNYFLSKRGTTRCLFVTHFGVKIWLLTHHNSYSKPSNRKLIAWLSLGRGNWKKIIWQTQNFCTSSMARPKISEFQPKTNFSKKLQSNHIQMQMYNHKPNEHVWQETKKYGQEWPMTS